jgi:Na+-driven multidrug efflux pump
MTRNLLQLTAQVIVLSLLLESGRSFNLVLVNALRAAGDARFTVLMGLLSMACMSLPLGHFLVFKMNLGLADVWLPVAADEWTRGIVYWHRWTRHASGGARPGGGHGLSRSTPDHTSKSRHSSKSNLPCHPWA